MKNIRENTFLNLCWNEFLSKQKGGSFVPVLCHLHGFFCDEIIIYVNTVTWTALANRLTLLGSLSSDRSCLHD